jgi:hypothetical protein
MIPKVDQSLMKIQLGALILSIGARDPGETDRRGRVKRKSVKTVIGVLTIKWELIPVTNLLMTVSCYGHVS